MPGIASMSSRQQVTKVVALLVMVVAPACTWNVSAYCGRMVRELDFSGRQAGQYTKQMLLQDMAPYSYFESPDRASIATVNGKSYLALDMKKGCYGTTTQCGMQGRLPLGVSLDEATMSMTVRFSNRFDWVRGGKLPGLCGGTCPTGCVTDDKGFSTRIMWTDNICTGARAAGVACTPGKSGGLHAYSYYKGKSQKINCGAELTYESKGRNGKRHDHVIYPNRDYEMSVHVRLNAKGKDDGDITIWLGRTKMGEVRGVEMRGPNQTFKIEQILFQNFFGGSRNMAAKKDEKIYIKDLRVWEGYCRPGTGSRTPIASSSSRSASSNAAFDKPSGSSGGSSSSWKQYSLEPSGFLKSGNPLRTQDLRIATAFTGGFCAKFNVKNYGSTTCEDYAVELNIDPSFGYLQKFGKSFAQLTADKGKGYYLFKRSGSLNPKIKPGTSRSEGFCALGNTKAQWRTEQLLKFFSVNVVCNGLSAYESGKRAVAV